MSEDSIPRTSGIYKITCTANGKIYIGSSNNLRRRWTEHRTALNRNNHVNKHLQRAWNKYGGQSFQFEVLELTMPCSLLDREQCWFDMLNPFGERGYNGNRIADKPPSQTGRTMSPEHRMIMSKVNKGHCRNKGRKLTPEHRANISEAQKGKVISLEQRQKISEAQKGKKQSLESIAKMVATRKANGTYTPSLEQREKLRKASSGHVHTVEHKGKIAKAHRKNYIVTSPTGIEYSISGLETFCEENHLSPRHMWAVANHKRQHHKGWKCRYD